MLCYDVLYYAVCAMLCTLCYAMLCYAMVRYATLFEISAAQCKPTCCMQHQDCQKDKTHGAIEKIYNTKASALLEIPYWSENAPLLLPCVYDMLNFSCQIVQSDG